MLCNTDEKMHKKIQKRLRIKFMINLIFLIILFPILMYNIIIIFQMIFIKDKTPNFFGIKTYVIISGSMKPDLEIGDVVIVRNVKENDLNKNDIISFRQSENVITHRIVEIIEEDCEKRFITKGDNNNCEDVGTIGYNSIEGKVIKTIPYLGKVALLLQKRNIIIILLIYLYLYVLFSERIKEKKVRRRLRIIRNINKKIRKKGMVL